VVWLGQNLQLLFEEDTEPGAGQTKRSCVGFQAIARDITAQKNHSRELAKTASTDALTGLPNRRRLMEKLSLEIERAERSGGPLSLCLCDLNLFRHSNDTWGHSAGDQVLVNFAAVLTQGLRETGMAGRLGGDEFLVILPGASAAEAAEIVNRSGARLAQLIFGEGQGRHFRAAASFWGGGVPRRNDAHGTDGRGGPNDVCGKRTSAQTGMQRGRRPILDPVFDLVRCGLLLSTAALTGGEFPRELNAYSGGEPKAHELFP
jgi:diguanylate cyclase (GGDEF)-like protein